MHKQQSGEQLIWFEQLANREYASVRAVCAHLIMLSGMDTSLSDDLVQDVFYLARVKLDILYTHPKPKAWLYKTAYYTYRNMRRRQLSVKLLDEESLAALRDPSAEAAYQALIPDDDKELVQSAVIKLSPSDQLLYFNLHQLGHSVSELCQIYQTNPGTVRKRIFRLHNRLAKNLRKISNVGI